MKRIIFLLIFMLSLCAIAAFILNAFTAEVGDRSGAVAVKSEKKVEKTDRIDEAKVTIVQKPQKNSGAPAQHPAIKDEKLLDTKQKIGSFAGLIQGFLQRLGF